MIAIGIAAMLSGGAARAEERAGAVDLEAHVAVHLDQARLLDRPAVPKKKSLSAQVKRNLTLLGDELGLHVSALTADLVRFRFDFARKFGQFRIGGGTDSFLFRVDGDVEVHGSVARVRSRLDLGLGGERVTLDLPEVDLATQSVAGERAYELRLPVFEGRF